MQRVSRHGEGLSRGEGLGLFQGAQDMRFGGVQLGAHPGTLFESITGMDG